MRMVGSRGINLQGWVTANPLHQLIRGIFGLMCLWLGLRVRDIRGWEVRRPALHLRDLDGIQPGGITIGGRVKVIPETGDSVSSGVSGLSRTRGAEFWAGRGEFAEC
jgi:hypothetical protein